MISKLVHHTWAKEEVNTAKHIRVIDQLFKTPLWRNYFVISESICTPAAIQWDRDIRTCEVTKKEVARKQWDELRVLHMPYGGVSMDRYSYPLSSFSFEDFAIHLIEGGALLQIIGISHRDLHEGNVLIDQAGVPRIIDFNWALSIHDSLSIDDFPSSGYDHNRTLSQEPPDTTLLHGIQNRRSVEDIVEDILTKKRLIRTLSIVLGRPFPLLRRELQMLGVYMMKTVEEPSAWYQTYWKTIDSWAIGVLLVGLIARLYRSPVFRQQYEGFKRKWIPLLRRMCEMDPRKRATCLDILQTLNPRHFLLRRR